MAKAKPKKRETNVVVAQSTEKFTFFWKIDSPFSQFHPAKFVCDGVNYNCCEQYMMHQKAVVFGDSEMAEKILKETSPPKMKAFGRKVSNFDPVVWDAKCKDIVKKGNLAKFSQNEHLKEALFKTIGTILAEASPRDTRWGIGLGATNPKALSKKTWRGKNWLGYILTQVRDELLESENDGSK